MTMIHKTGPVDIKALDESQGRVIAAVNTLGIIDHDGEVLAHGAFTESIGRTLPAVAWFHNQTAIVGGVVEAKEDAGRLLVTMQFDLDTEPGAYAFKMVQRHRVKEWSVGFFPVAHHWEERDGRQVRVYDKVDWFEVSPVLRGASPGTQTLATKQQDAATKGLSFEATRRAIELALRPVEPLPGMGVEVREWWWVIETYPAHAIACRESPDGVTYWQVPYSLTAAGDVQLGTPVQVEQTYTPVQRGALMDGTLSALKGLAALLTSAPATSDTADAAGTDQARATLAIVRARLALKGIPAGAVKVGRRASGADQQRIQAAHDALVTMGATCTTTEEE